MSYLKQAALFGRVVLFIVCEVSLEQAKGYGSCSVFAGPPNETHG